MKHPHEHIGWLYEIASGLGWQVSLWDILRVEKEYPGLMDDIAVEHWQRDIIAKQMEGTGQRKRADNEIDGQGER